MNDKKTDWSRTARFLFEGSTLKRTWRTGYAFLGKGRESVAAHTFGVTLIAMMLAREVEGVDVERLLKLSLLHDLPEARTGDANAVHKLYGSVDEDLAVSDMVRGLDGGAELSDLLTEYREGNSEEAVLVHDADQLDMLLSLKEHLDTGSKDAGLWIPHVRSRLRSEPARALAEAILEEHWASWWMGRLLDNDV
jgi:putative hydrolase of HD superfamily